MLNLKVINGFYQISSEVYIYYILNSGELSLGISKYFSITSCWHWKIYCLNCLVVEKKSAFTSQFTCKMSAKFFLFLLLHTGRSVTSISLLSLSGLLTISKWVFYRLISLQNFQSFRVPKILYFFSWFVTCVCIADCWVEEIDPRWYLLILNKSTFYENRLFKNRQILI